tara:strand:- start:5977 stop:7257 length:1281 start_codon:yes stop_codon:yes gene_type:complete
MVNNFFFGKNFLNKVNTSNYLIKNHIKNTPLLYNKRLSDEYGTNIYFKREDLQTVRSFKIRGALNKIIKTDSDIIVTASAGNHAQGVAYSCQILNKKGMIVIPNTTPKQKIDRINYFGKDNINIIQYGSTFIDSLEHALNLSEQNNYPFIHPYDDYDIIEGQATIASEIIKKINVDIVLSCVGGGGLISGVGSYLKNLNNNIKIFGVEPKGAESLKLSLDKNERVQLENIDNFVDGASVSQVGKINFDICKEIVDDVFVVSNEKLSYDMIDCYQNDGIILEPAGTLAVSGLKDLINYYKINLPNEYNDLHNKNIVCILSGGNNDISRYNEIIELSLLYQNLKHYFILKFVQKPNELKTFINNILGPEDDIVRFEYMKKTNKKHGNVLIGIELKNEKDIGNILKKLKYYKFEYKKIDEKEIEYELLI